MDYEVTIEICNHCEQEIAIQKDEFVKVSSCDFYHADCAKELMNEFNDIFKGKKSRY